MQSRGPNLLAKDKKGKRSHAKAASLLNVPQVDGPSDEFAPGEIVETRVVDENNRDRLIWLEARIENKHADGSYDMKLLNASQHKQKEVLRVHVPISDVRPCGKGLGLGHRKSEINEDSDDLEFDEDKSGLLQSSKTARNFNNKIESFENSLQPGGETIRQTEFLENVKKADESTKTYQKRGSVRVRKTVFEKQTKNHKYVNQYMLLQSLGEGSMGKVRKAISLENLKPYAIKIIDKKRFQKEQRLQGRRGLGGRPKRGLGGRPKRGLGGRPGRKSSFGMASKMLGDAPPKSMTMGPLAGEIAVMKKIDHPNCVRLFEVISDDTLQGNMYLVMEYFPKGSVLKQDEESEDPLMFEPIKDLETIRGYVRDICWGLSYLHANRVTHKDLKPDNMLIGNDGRIKISDFGVSDLLGVQGASSINTLLGTPAFHSPETITASSWKAWPVDVWAFGISVFMFIAGKPPFYSPNLGELYNKIKKDEVVFPKGTDKWLMDLISKMLHKNPAKRLTLEEVEEHPFFIKGLDRNMSARRSTMHRLSAYSTSRISISNVDRASALTHRSRLLPLLSPDDDEGREKEVMEAVEKVRKMGSPRRSTMRRGGRKTSRRLRFAPSPQEDEEEDSPMPAPRQNAILSRSTEEAKNPTTEYIQNSDLARGRKTLVKQHSSKEVDMEFDELLTGLAKKVSQKSLVEKSPNPDESNKRAAPD